MKNARVSSTNLGVVLTLALSSTALIPLDAQAADALLSGSIASAAGEKLGGVTVSAKADGSTITKTVFTDESGNYYFPPLLEGKYKVWAQALTFATATGNVDLAAARKQNFTLNPITDWQQQVHQLPGDIVYASLPEASEQDARMKTLVKNNCTGCHTLSYTLQHRFDEEGWNKIIELMKNVNVSGVNVAHERKVNGILDTNQKELAAYLARARAGRDLDEAETAAAASRRGRPRRVHRI